jgi:hypothetical protein
MSKTKVLYDEDFRYDTPGDMLKMHNAWLYLERLNGGIAGFKKDDPQIAPRLKIIPEGLEMKRLAHDLGPWREHAPRIEIVPGYRPHWQEHVRFAARVTFTEKHFDEHFMQVMNKRKTKGSTPHLQLDVHDGNINARYKIINGPLIRKKMATYSDYINRTVDFVLGAYFHESKGYYKIWMDGELKFQWYGKTALPASQMNLFQFQYGLYSGNHNPSYSSIIWNHLSISTVEEDVSTVDIPSSDEEEYKAPDHKELSGTINIDGIDYDFSVPIGDIKVRRQ